MRKPRIEGWSAYVGGVMVDSQTARVLAFREGELESKYLFRRGNQFYLQTQGDRANLESTPIIEPINRGTAIEFWNRCRDRLPFRGCFPESIGKMEETK